MILLILIINLVYMFNFSNNLDTTQTISIINDLANFGTHHHDYIILEEQKDGTYKLKTAPKPKGFWAFLYKIYKPASHRYENVRTVLLDFVSKNKNNLETRQHIAGNLLNFIKKRPVPTQLQNRVSVLQQLCRPLQKIRDALQNARDTLSQAKKDAEGMDAVAQVEAKKIKEEAEKWGEMHKKVCKNSVSITSEDIRFKMRKQVVISEVDEKEKNAMSLDEHAQAKPINIPEGFFTFQCMNGTVSIPKYICDFYPTLEQCISPKWDNKLSLMKMDYSVSIMKKFVDFLYVQQIEKATMEELLELYQLADFFQIESLKNACQDALSLMFVDNNILLNVTIKTLENPALASLREFILYTMIDLIDFEQHPFTFTMCKQFKELLKSHSEPICQTMLAACDMYGFGGAIDYASGVTRLTSLNEYPPAKYFLSKCYDKGLGVTKNPSKTFQLLQEASQSYSQAINLLARNYDDGSNINKNPQKAFELYQRASDLGSISATSNLGVCYKIGYECEKDYSKAFQLYTIGAKKGSRWAQYNLGNCYDDGHGTTKNRELAIYWYTVAADNGYKKAKEKLQNLVNE